MTETIPEVGSTDRSDAQDVETAPCSECAHPECRGRRASQQSRVRGHTAEFAAEHRTAAAVQASHPGVVVWFGEATQSFWAATPTGLTEAGDADTLLLGLRHHTRADPGRTSSTKTAGRTAPARGADPAGPNRLDIGAAAHAARITDSDPLVLGIPTAVGTALPV